MAYKPIRVLLVEDNPGDERVIRLMLHTEDDQFHVSHVGRLSDALEQLEQHNTDVVLLDLSLPDSSGLVTLDRVRAQDPDTPIIVITGLPEKEIAVQALGRGARDFIAKEFVDVHLLNKAILRSIRPGG